MRDYLPRSWTQTARSSFEYSPELFKAGKDIYLEVAKAFVGGNVFPCRLTRFTILMKKLSNRIRDRKEFETVPNDSIEIFIF